MDWEKEPTLAEFAKTFDLYVKEIMNDNDPDEFIYSHRIKGDIRVCNDDDDDDSGFQIVGLELDQLIGCGCPAGIVIKVKKVQ